MKDTTAVNSISKVLLQPAYDQIQTNQQYARVELTVEETDFFGKKTEDIYISKSIL